MLKSCFCVFITSSCACLIVCSSYQAFYITICFYSCIFSFLVWSFWVAICLIAISAVFFPVVVICISCLIFNCFAMFLLMVLRILGFINCLFSTSISSWRAICLVLSCSTTTAVEAVALYALCVLGVLFSMTLYSFIVQIFGANALLKMNFKLSKIDIKLKIQVYYTIKNLLGLFFFF